MISPILIKWVILPKEGKVWQREKMGFFIRFFMDFAQTINIGDPMSA
jgi:hypothetical protein